MQKSIFVHIPKCAGCSLWQSISKSEQAKNIEYFGHGAGRMSKPFPEHDIYQDFFSFTFARNPFDRLVSSFFFLKSGGHNQYNQELYNKYMRTRSGTFKDFIMYKFNQESIDNVS